MASPAVAAEGEVVAVAALDSLESVRVVASLLALVLAAALLVAIVRLERVAKGSAIAESVAFVVAAALCLAASSLGRWVSLFVATESAASQLRVFADFLIVASTGLFAYYFWRVARALTRFMRGSQEVLAKMKAADDDWYATDED